MTTRGLLVALIALVLCGTVGGVGLLAFGMPPEQVGGIVLMILGWAALFAQQLNLRAALKENTAETKELKEDFKTASEPIKQAADEAKHKIEAAAVVAAAKIETTAAEVASALAPPKQ